MNIYFNHGSPKVYINVGGRLAAAGTRAAKKLMQPGLPSRDVLSDSKAI